MELRLDALLIFILIGLLISMLCKFLWYRLVRFIKQVSYMKSLAGGTFVADAEAAYWMDLIKRRDYRPIWRWYFGEKWRKKHKQDKVRLITEKEKRRRAKHRKIQKAAGISSAIIAIGIAVVLFVPQILVIENVQTTSRVLVSDNAYWLDGKLQRSNTSLDVSLVIQVYRVDKIRDARSVSITVQGVYVDIFDPTTDNTTNGPVLYGAGFGKVDLATLKIIEFTMSYNRTNSVYTYTIVLPRDGMQVMFIYIGIRGDLVFPACQKLAEVRVQGDISGGTPLGIYERGCPYGAI